MGEITEMILNGDLCEGCMVAIGDNGPGYPRRCDECGPIDMTPFKFNDKRTLPAPRKKKTNCPECGKRVKKVGLADHMHIVHGK